MPNERQPTGPISPETAAWRRGGGFGKMSQDEILLHVAHGDQAKVDRWMKAAAEKQLVQSSIKCPRFDDPLREAECPHCHDAGWLYSNAPEGDAMFGKTVPCASCNTQWRAKTTGIPQWEKTFETFNLVKAPDMQDAYDFARTVADTEVPPWLILLGGRGNGKTHLALAAARVLFQKNKSVRWWYVPKLLDRLRSTFAPDSKENIEEAMKRYAETPEWLFLDELGVQKTSDWVRERLEMIIDYRYHLRKGLVVTCNCTWEELESQLPRTASRFTDHSLCEAVPCMGEDYRPKLERLEVRHEKN